MKTRKLLALVLAIAMIATIFVVPSAAVAPGAACEILGLLQGEEALQPNISLKAQQELRDY